MTVPAGSVTKSTYAIVSSPSSKNLMKRSLSRLSGDSKEIEPRLEAMPIEPMGSEPESAGVILERSACSTLLEERESDAPSQANDNQMPKRMRLSLDEVEGSPMRKHCAAEVVATSVRDPTNTTMTLTSAAPPDPNVDIAFGVDDNGVYAGNQALLRLVTDDVLAKVKLLGPERRKRVGMKLVRTLLKQNKSVRFVKAIATIRKMPEKETSLSYAAETVWKSLNPKEAAIETVWFLENLVRMGIIQTRAPPVLSSSDEERVQSLSLLRRNDVEKALSLIYVPRFPAGTSTPITYEAAVTGDSDATVSSALNPLPLSHGSLESLTGFKRPTNASCTTSNTVLEDTPENNCSVPIADMDFLLDLDVEDLEQEEGALDLSSEKTDCDMTGNDHVLELGDLSGLEDSFSATNDGTI